MKDVVCAALAKPARSFLLIDPLPPLFQVVANREETISVLIVTSTRRKARRFQHQIGLRGEKPPPVSLIQSNVDSLPFHCSGFDAVVMATGLPQSEDPVATLITIRQLLRPGGAMLVVSRLREGPMGGMTSLLKRMMRKAPLPRATDLTSWMLLAGVQQIRQASVPRSAVPTVLTWGEIRARPWENRTPQGQQTHAPVEQPVETPVDESTHEEVIAAPD